MRIRLKCDICMHDDSIDWQAKSPVAIASAFLNIIAILINKMRF
jgi:hypothetical protein